jgi:hypothetical protein
MPDEAMPTSRLGPRDRYLRDPAFHALVSLMVHAIELRDYTPTELREAIMLAAKMVEERRPAEPRDRDLGRLGKIDPDLDSESIWRGMRRVFFGRE